MLAIDAAAPPTFEDGVMFYHATLDGVPVRAGITLDAFEQLMARAGFDANHDLGGVMIVDMVAMLQPTIEAYLQAKHFHVGSDQPLLIDTPDLLRH